MLLFIYANNASSASNASTGNWMSHTVVGSTLSSNVINKSTMLLATTPYRNPAKVASVLLRIRVWLSEDQERRRRPRNFQLLSPTNSPRRAFRLPQMIVLGRRAMVFKMSKTRSFNIEGGKYKQWTRRAPTFKERVCSLSKGSWRIV